MAVSASALMCVFLLHCVATSAGLISNIKFPSQRQESTQEPPPLNNRPLIGILSQPGDGCDHETTLMGTEHPASYIAAGYVKFVESGGARAVPLFYDEPEESLRKVSPCSSTSIHFSELKPPGRFRFTW